MNRTVLISLAFIVACKGNEAPGAPTVSITGGLDTTTDLVATIDEPSVDVDEDGVTYAYAWTVDGVAATEFTGDTVPADRTAAGEVWAVTVTPNDGELDGASATADVTIGNSAPTVSVAFDPATATTETTLTAEVTAADLDGDTLTTTYTWKVNGAAVGEASDTLSGDAFVRGDVVRVEVVVTDGNGGEGGASIELTVGNTAPSGPEGVTIDPAVPLDSADLICRPSGATNIDDDSVSYTIAWERDGAPFTGAKTTEFPGDTVPADQTAPGQVWACTATATDGTDAGGSDRAEVTVLAWEGPIWLGTCGATGQNGPTQAACDVVYAGTPADGELVVTAGYQAWTVPFSGRFTIDACGAQGASGTTTYVGGKGACVTGTYDLVAGEVIDVVVGQLGTGVASSSNGGGGGASWVVAEGDALLAVAGGGGGTRASAGQSGCDAVAGEYGVLGSGSSNTSTCTVATTGLGDGGATSSSSWGSGGGGYLTDGGDDSTFGTGGASWLNGLRGGDNNGSSCGLNAVGGFGGGGAGNGCYGGGGGGGYSGGGGGWIAGGGGSYNADATGTETGAANEGDGWVRIRVEGEVVEEK